MTMLVLGLVLFLGVHSTRIVADGWRSRTIARIGETPWKVGYALAAVAGFVLVVWGYGLARQNPVVLWTAPVGMTHLSALLMVVALVLLVATYVPGNSIKARLHHPMLLSVKVWAAAHLLANGMLADLLLFGGFLAWAVLCFRSARQRDRANSVVYAPGKTGPTAVAVVLGLVLWAAFVMGGHAWLFGVRPLGG